MENENMKAVEKIATENAGRFEKVENYRWWIRR